MIRLAVTALKGGVAKSMLAHSLASSFARSMPTLLVDCDATHTASEHCGYSHPETQNLFLDALLGNIEPHSAVVPTTTKNLSLLPSSWAMFASDKTFASEPGADGLLAALFNHASMQKYQAIVVDTPPSICDLTYMAMIASDSGLVVPAECSAASLSAMKALFRCVSLLKERRCSTVNVVAVVPTRVTRTKSSNQAIEMLRENFGELVTKSQIDESIVVKDAVAHTKSIIEYRPKSKSAQQCQAVYKELYKRIQENLKHGHAA